MKRITKPVPESYMCLWYMAGDLHRKRRTASLTDADDNRMPCLSIFGFRWARHQCMTGVRHKDDPFLKRRPIHARENGCWDYLPTASRLTAADIHDLEVHLRKPTPPVEDSPKDIASLTPEVKDQLATLADAGSSAVEIAEVLTAATNEKWTHQRVNAILRSMQTE